MAGKDDTGKQDRARIKAANDRNRELRSKPESWWRNGKAPTDGGKDGVGKKDGK